MIPTNASIPRERELPTTLSDAETRTSQLVRCFRHEGEDCPRCDGSGHRLHKCGPGCGEPAGRPSEGSKVLQSTRAARNWKEARNLPLYCWECNPRFASLTALAVLERMGG